MSMRKNSVSRYQIKNRSVFVAHDLSCLLEHNEGADETDRAEAEDAATEVEAIFLLWTRVESARGGNALKVLRACLIPLTWDIIDRSRGGLIGKHLGLISRHRTSVDEVIQLTEQQRYRYMS